MNTNIRKTNKCGSRTKEERCMFTSQAVASLSIVFLRTAMQAGGPQRIKGN
jgi:hypothetical protein